MSEENGGYVLGPPEPVSDDDPIVHGRRWKAERDQARAQARQARAQARMLAQAIRDSGHVGPHLNCPLCETLNAYELARLRGH